MGNRRTARTPRREPVALALFVILAALAPSDARAAIELNLDFGTFYGVPSAEDGAAAAQPGVWNEAPIGVTSLVDTAGVATLVEVEVVATSHGSAGGGNDMIRDNFYATGGDAWSVDLAGVPNGLYVVYVYAPTNTGVVTGSFTINGQAFASLPGDASGDYIEGTSYLKTVVDVDTGTISLSGSDASFSGLAGVQVVPISEGSFNLDFGIFYGVPSAEDGAAAAQPGVWNEAPIGITPLVDTAGAVTLVEVEVVATSHGSAGGGNDMIRDNFYATGGNAWSVDVTGLENGLYVVYVYAPTNAGVVTGSFTINGQAFASLPGDASGDYIEGTSYLKTAVDVDAGAISLSGSDASFSGLSGMQVVRIPPAHFNLDFGIFYGVPSAEDGAAAAQPGIWNEAPIGVTPLLDTSGAITLVEVEVVAANHGSAGGGNDMIRDNFYATGGNAWSVDVTGLENGLYVVYVYAPTNTSVVTGSFTINGVGFSSLPGDASGDYIEGTSYLKTAVDLDAGTISLSGSDPSFSGLSGMQIVPVPEPGFGALLGTGVLLAGWLSRRRRG